MRTRYISLAALAVLPLLLSGCFKFTMDIEIDSQDTVSGQAAVGLSKELQAFAQAEELDTDLVEIAPKAAPPVCRLMDFGKYKYAQSKQMHAARMKQKNVQVKEIKFRPGTDDGDYNIKLKKIKSFINDGDKTKISVRFRGREILNSNLGLELLNRLRDDLQDIAQVDQEPSLEGKQLLMVLSQIRKK